MGHGAAADDERSDQHRIAAVAGLHCLAVDVLDDRGQARLAEAVLAGGLAFPACGDLAARGAGSHDPHGVEVEQLSQKPARRVVAQRGHKANAGTGLHRRIGPPGAPRCGRRVAASQAWKHDSRQARRSPCPVASPERGNQVKIT